MSVTFSDAGVRGSYPSFVGGVSAAVQIFPAMRGTSFANGGAFVADESQAINPAAVSTKAGTSEGQIVSIRAAGYVNMSGSSPSPIDAILGVASAYAVLAYSGITNTGALTITGNIGSSSVPATLSGMTLVPPSIIDNAGATAARSAGQMAYTHYAGLVFSNLGGGLVDLSTANGSGGNTYTPGNYSAGSMHMSTGIVLNGAGVYVFKAASTVNQDSGQGMTLSGGATLANTTVVWLVGSSFSQSGVGGIFIGNILAIASITFAGTETLKGRALAIGGGNGAVTFAAGGSVTISDSAGSTFIIKLYQGSSINPELNVLVGFSGAIPATVDSFALTLTAQGTAPSAVIQFANPSLLVDGVPTTFNLVGASLGPYNLLTTDVPYCIGIQFGTSNAANIAALQQFCLES